MNKSSLVAAPQLRSVGDTLQILGIGKSTFYALVKADKLCVVKIGRRTLVPQTTIERFVADLQATGEAA